MFGTTPPPVAARCSAGGEAASAAGWPDPESTRSDPSLPFTMTASTTTSALLTMPVMLTSWPCPGWDGTSVRPDGPDHIWGAGGRVPVALRSLIEPTWMSPGSPTRRADHVTSAEMEGGTGIKQTRAGPSGPRWAGQRRRPRLPAGTTTRPQPAGPDAGQTAVRYANLYRRPARSERYIIRVVAARYCLPCASAPALGAKTTSSRPFPDRATAPCSSSGLARFRVTVWDHPLHGESFSCATARYRRSKRR